MKTIYSVIKNDPSILSWVYDPEAADASGTGSGEKTRAQLSWDDVQFVRKTPWKSRTSYQGVFRDVEGDDWWEFPETAYTNEKAWKQEMAQNGEVLYVNFRSGLVGMNLNG